MRSIGSLLLVGSVLLSACSSVPVDDDEVAQDEAAVAGVCTMGSAGTRPATCGAFEFRLPWRGGVRRVVTQGMSTDNTHKSGTKDAYAFDFRVRACDADPTVNPSATAAELEVRAVAKGKVVDARFTKSEIAGVENVNFVLLEHALPDGSKVLSLYAHLKKETTAPVSVGTTVERGAKLGRIGASGTDKAHLHFQFQSVPSATDCGTKTTSMPKGNTYPFCKSKSYLAVNPCGFEESAALKYGVAFTSENY
jgi:hypothetical protein